MFRLQSKVTHLLLAITIVITASTSAATAKNWKKYRETARKAAQANQYDFALDQYALAFKEAEAAFKGTDLRFLETVSEAAQFHTQFRRFDEAIQMYQAALDRMPRPRGGEQNFKVAFLTAIGHAHKYAKRLEAATLSFREAIEYAEEKFAEQSPLLAEAIEGLAGVYIERHQPDEALRLLKRALHSASYAPSGTRSSETSVQNTIGILHLSQSNFVDAEKAFREALKSVNRERAVGGFNFIKSNTANIERNLAQTYRAQRDFSKAEDALFRSIAITEKLEGSAVATAQSLAILAAVHFEQNDSALDKLFARLTSKKADQEKFLPYIGALARQYSIRDWPRTELLLHKAIAAAPQHAAELNALRARLAAEPKQSPHRD